MLYNNQDVYDVIVIGGGPVGIALALELGLNSVKTLVIEKHDEPLKIPRAQSLSARSVEFFLRWGIDDALENALLIPKTFPQSGVWCTSLCGDSFFESLWGDNDLGDGVSPKCGLRIPIWRTEEVLRNRLKDFNSVNFLKNVEVTDVEEQKQGIVVTAKDTLSNTKSRFDSTFVACCDGVTGPSKSLLKNSYDPMSDKTRMLGMLFTSPDIMDIKTVDDAIMYFVVSDDTMAFVGPVDLKENLWLAQVVWNDEDNKPSKAKISSLIDKFVGQPINKEVVSHYFWDMQVQIAKYFSQNDRIFWLGDSAHAFAPTGGLGLNTGFGDAQNLGWKLAHYLQKKAPSRILSTYEQERRPVCTDNLNFAKGNAEEFLKLKQLYPPGQDKQKFSRAYAELGNKYLKSSGLTLGYSYRSSMLTDKGNIVCKKSSPFFYRPRAIPGNFLPHVNYAGNSIYKLLSSTSWNVLVNGVGKPDCAPRFDFPVNLIQTKQSLYEHKFLLVRPDWHIAKIGSSMQEINGFLATEEVERCLMI